MALSEKLYGVDQTDYVGIVLADVTLQAVAEPFVNLAVESVKCAGLDLLIKHHLMQAFDGFGKANINIFQGGLVSIKQTGQLVVGNQFDGVCAHEEKQVGGLFF